MIQMILKSDLHIKRLSLLVLQPKPVEEFVGEAGEDVAAGCGDRWQQDTVMML